MKKYILLTIPLFFSCAHTEPLTTPDGFIVQCRATPLDRAEWACDAAECEIPVACYIKVPVAQE